MTKRLLKDVFENINLFLTKNTRKKLLVTFLISCFFENIILLNAGLNVKLVHVLSLILIPLAIIYKSKYNPTFKAMLLITALYIQTGLAYSKYGFNLQIFNLIFCTFVVFLSWQLSDDFDLCDWKWIGKNASMFLFLIILINLGVQIKGIWEFLLIPHVGHPRYISVFGGNCNLDASWLGIFSFISVGSAMWVPMVVFTAIFSALVNSRAGLLSAFAFFTWASVQWIRKKMNKKVEVLFWRDWNKKQKLLSTTITFLIIIAFTIMQGAAFHVQNKEINSHIDNSIQSENSANNGSDNEEPQGVIENVVERTLSIGKEPGSIGRLRMWRKFWSAGKENIWGYGLGNGIEAIKSKALAEDGMLLEEGNIHNIYMQVFLDQGVIGALILLALLFAFIYREFSTLAANPLAGFILCYMCLGILQYRFLDVSFWFIVGAYLSLMKVHKEIVNENFNN